MIPFKEWFGERMLYIEDSAPWILGLLDNLEALKDFPFCFAQEEMIADLA